MEGMTLALLALAVLLVLLLFLGVKSVPQGEEWTVERFGRYVRTLRPGLNLIVPMVESIGRRMTMMEQVLDIPSQEVITRDNALVTVDAVVFFQVLDAARAAYEVADLERAIVNLTMTNLRTVLGSMDLDEALSKRDEINARLLAVVDEATGPWGVKVTRIEIKDITPPQDLVEAMARQMKAERDKRAQILLAEGEREAAILRAEGEKQAAVLEAEGRREAAFRDAEARERLAEAEARATEWLARAAADGGRPALNYYVAQKYLDALAQFATSPQQKTLVLPVEATGILGALAGIAELARDSLAGRGGGTAEPDTATAEPASPAPAAVRPDESAPEGRGQEGERPRRTSVPPTAPESREGRTEGGAGTGEATP